MKKPVSSIVFDQEFASSYDQQREKLAPIKNALHLCLQMILSELPVDARILCVGAGTGSELVSLAQAYPQWVFTVVEPAPEMMKVCRQQADKFEITSRCSFHEGYINSLAESDPFDAATSILVSHFIIEIEERVKFFSEIARRLHPGGHLINADLASDTTGSDYNAILRAWFAIHNYANMPLKIESFGRNVAVLPTNKIESIITSSGLVRPILFFQTLLIHAWHSKATA